MRLSISLDEVTFEPITVTFSVGTPDILKSQIRLPNPPIYVDDVNGTNISILLKDKNG